MTEETRQSWGTRAIRSARQVPRRSEAWKIPECVHEGCWNRASTANSAKIVVSSLPGASPSPVAVAPDELIESEKTIQ